MIDTENRGLLRTIKVPFDIKAIFLGGVGYLIFIAGGWLLNEIFKAQDVLSGFFREGLSACSIPLRSIPLIGNEISGVLTSLYGAGTPALTWIEMLVAGIWFFLILSVFGGAIARILAMRISRDDSVGAVDAVKFSIANLPSFLLIPVFLGIAIAFFWGCNLLAGLAYSIPVLGPFLNIILLPLVILSSLIILLIAVGGLLGLFMMVSAVSTEKNGTLDAISRAFSYIYSRPLQFFFYYFLVFLMAAVICLIALVIFPGIITGSFSTGVANQSYDMAFQFGAASACASDLPALKGIGFFDAIGVLVTWFFMIILMIGIKGFVITYIMGGTTAIYFALRRDVDGTEDSEIYIEGDDEFDEFDLPPVTPAEPEEEKKEEKEEKEEEPAEGEKEGEPAAEEEAAEEEPEEEAEEEAAEEEPEEEAEEEGEEEEGGEEEEEEEEKKEE